MSVDAWLAAAVADAERRGLPELKAMLETLARSTDALRKAEETLQRSEATDTSPDDDRQ
jgi:hypothetical protein